MKIALKEAESAWEEGEVPVGAVLVSGDGTVLASDHNRCIQLSDPTAHAEVLVLREAGQKLKNYRLPETTLFVTVEPCPMCAGAIVNARVKKVIIGARDERYGACGSVFEIIPSPHLNHRPEVVWGVLERECGALLKKFFQEKRSGIMKNSEK